MKKAVMLFAEGFETVEALMVVDILRRGGVELTMASITEDSTVKSSHGVAVGMDALLSEVDVSSYDAVILPGGLPGTTHLKESEQVRETLFSMNEAGKLVAAICAAPSVLGRHGLLEGKKACCYPGVEEQLKGAKVTEDRVTVDGNIVTSRALGTAMEFAFTLLEKLAGAETAEDIKGKIVYQPLA